LRLERVVIIGGSFGGVRAAEVLREQGYSGAILMISAETHPPYRRPPLSKNVLLGEQDLSDILLPLDQDFNRQLRLGIRATALDPVACTITLETGEQVPYDGLIIATGAEARRPKLPGGDCLGILTLRSYDDARSLRAALLLGGHAIIVGAGLIGCEVAACATVLGLNVTLIDVAAAPMSRVLGAKLGEAVAAMHQVRGVRMEMQSTVTAIVRDRDRYIVMLDGSRRVIGDVVVCATGSRPATDWLESSGIVLHDGVVCDARCVAIDGERRVVAAGDVARWPHADYDNALMRIEHWTNAGEQAAAAATALLHGEAAPAFRPVPSFWSDQYGHRLQAYGAPWLATRHELVTGSLEDEKFLALCWHGDRLVAAVAIDMPGPLAACRSRLLTEKSETIGG